MDTMIGFAGVVIATLVALFAALALEMALLKATLLFMQPATTGRRTTHPNLQRGTQLVARAYARNK
jgi:hypothetical protein